MFIFITKLIPVASFRDVFYLNYSRNKTSYKQGIYMIKFTILLKQKSTMTHQEFVAYHREKHAPLFSSLPAVKKHVRRYVQQHTVPLDIPGLPPMKYDGITEIWFDSKEDIGAVFNDPEYLAKIRPDEEQFLDLNGCDFVVSEENIVISL